MITLTQDDKTNSVTEELQAKPLDVIQRYVHPSPILTNYFNKARLML